MTWFFKSEEKAQEYDTEYGAQMEFINGEYVEGAYRKLSSLVRGKVEICQSGKGLTTQVSGLVVTL